MIAHRTLSQNQTTNCHNIKLTTTVKHVNCLKEGRNRMTASLIKGERENKETQRDTQRRRETQRDTQESQRDTETRRETEHKETQATRRDTKSHKETQNVTKKRHKKHDTND